MATKINVSIPDELQAEAAPFMDEISPSKIYQDALKAKVCEVKKHREIQPGGEEMDSITERLRQEKDVFFEVSKREEGYQEGIKFAKTAEYEALWAAVQLSRAVTLNKDDVKAKIDDYSWETIEIQNKKLLQYFFTLIDNSDIPIEKRVKNNSVFTFSDGIAYNSKIAVQWLIGWEKGVLDFWNKLPDDLKS